MLLQFKRSKDGRSLASNFSYLMLMQVANYLFPLITIPYLARVIGVEGFGKIAFAASVVVWFQTVSDWGFNYTATRDVARCKEEPDQVSEIFSNVFWARVLLSLLSFVLLCIAIETVPYLTENRVILLLTFLVVPGQVIFPQWYFQAVERMKFITIFTLISRAVFTGLVFVFINEPSDFVLQPLFISAGYFLTGTLAMYLIVFRWRVRIARPKWKGILMAIRASSDVFINNFLPNLYNSFAVVLLGFWSGPAATGVYDAGKKFVLLAHSLLSLVVRASFPYFARRLDRHDEFAKVYLAIAAGGAIAAYVIAPQIIDLFFTDEFAEAVTVLRISSLSIFFVALSRVYGTTYLLLLGYEKSLRNITFVCSILGLAISIPLVFNFSYIGASVALVVTQTLLGTALMIKARAVRKSTAHRVEDEA